MAFRALSKAVLLLGVLHGADITAQDQGSVSTSASVQAEQQARAKLAEHLKISPDEIKVTRSEPQSWSDSSMGCGSRDAVALSVITEGHAVVLSAQGREYNVHVSRNGGVVCDKGAQPRRETRAANLRGLDQMMQRAREDLAKRLGADPAKIRVAGMKPQRWENSALGCPREGEPIRNEPVSGVKLSLRYAGRIYTYHTDRKDLRPCPAIEAE